MDVITIDDVIAKVKAYLPGLDEKKVRHAYEYASEAHKGQKRYSGEPYIIHPLYTAYFLADFHPDEDSLIAALLHDVSEDTHKTLEDIGHKFGIEIRELVYGMEKLSKVRSRENEPQVENLRKMFLVMAKDFRVVMIKLCDRLHNICTLKYVPQEKQKRIAKETLEIYAPIAARLGIYRLKTQLEDHAFEFLEPEQYRDIVNQLEATHQEREGYIADAKKILQALLAKNGIQGIVEGRHKGIYSIYRKMKRKGKSLIGEVFDIFAMRVVLPNIFKHDEEFNGHLYTMLGVLHSEYTPLAHRFKDYVAVPKVNGYRSLHTTIIGLGPKSYRQPTEIQIRTQLMHEQAEYGVAAHWMYEGLHGASAERFEANINHDGEMDKEMYLTSKILKEQMQWIQGLSRLQEEITSDEELMRDLHVDVFQDRIFVFTPTGDVKDLPRGATPVDFAYAVHTDIGHTCAQAKVNGSIVPLSYKLKNGEVIEIITRQNAQPSQNWLSFVTTNHAKNRIRSWIRSLDRDKNIRVGRELLNRHLERISKPPLDPDLTILKTIDGEKLAYRDREDLIVDVAKGTMMPGALLRKIFSLEEIFRNAIPVGRDRRAGTLKKNAKETRSVYIGGRTDMPIQFASCCKPNEWDPICGYITKGKGITIHSRACRMLASDGDQHRIYDAYWVSPDTGRLRVYFHIEANDRVGLIRDLSNVFSNASINIVDFTYGTGQGHSKNGVIDRNICVEMDNFDNLEDLLNELETIPNVIRATLGAPQAVEKVARRTR